MGNCCGGKDEPDSEISKYKNYGLNKDEKRQDQLNGPIENRSCTDIICCILFTICILGFFGISLWAFTFGDIRRVVYPTDSSGSICGHEVKGKTKLVFFNLITCLKLGPAVFWAGCPTPQVCVDKCPDYNWIYQVASMKEKLKQNAEREKMICLGHKNASTDPNLVSKTIEQLVDSGICAPIVVKSTSIGRRCMPGSLFDLLSDLKIPKNLTKTEDKTARTLSKFLSVVDVGKNIVEDIINSWRSVLVFAFIALLLSLTWIILLRCISKVIIWTIVILTPFLFLAWTAICLLRYVALSGKSAELQSALSKLNESEKMRNFVTGFSTPSDSFFNQPKTWLVTGIISAIITLIVIIILIFLRKRIQIAIALIGEASRAVGHILSTLIWPLFPLAMVMIVTAFTLTVAAYLGSVRGPVGAKLPTDVNMTDTDIAPFDVKMQDKMRNLAHDFPCDMQNKTSSSLCYFIRYGGREYVTFLQLYNLFVGLWIFNFMVDLGRITLAGAFASYFFARDKSTVPTFPLLGSLARTLRYHMGSVAFGALIITIIEAIRALLEYLDMKLKKTDNGCARFMIKCLKCCFWCLEKFLRFINKNAYIMIAIYGQNFCSAAKNSFFLLLRNVVRVVVIDRVTDFLLFLGAVVVIVSMGMLSYFFYDGTLAAKMTFLEKVTPDLNYFILAVIIVVIITYIIAKLFFGVYKMAVDTLFLCFLEDEERNDGSPGKQYLMSEELRNILTKHNEAPEAKRLKSDVDEEDTKI